VPISWTSSNASRDEARLDGVLQQAANAALVGRDGTIIIMDPHTGRVRALVNPDGRLSSGVNAGFSAEPFTALAACAPA